MSSSRTLHLEQAVKTNQTPMDDDQVAVVTLNRSGDAVFFQYASLSGLPTDIPDTPVAIYRIDDYKILINAPLFSLTAVQLRAARRYVLTAAISPSFRKFVVASVYQNYSNPADPNNTIAVDGTVTPGILGDFRHDITLDVYTLSSDLRSASITASEVVARVYLAPLTFTVNWTDPEFITVSYPVGTVATNTEPTPQILSAYSPSLTIVASGISPILSNIYYTFRLDRTYIVGTGSATNQNGIMSPSGGFTYLHNIQTPSGIFVFTIDKESSSLTEVAMYKLTAFSRYIDVKVVDDRAYFLNVSRLPQVLDTSSPYYEYSGGVQAPFYVNKSGTSALIVRFNGRTIKLVRSIDTGLPSVFSSKFIPFSDDFVVTSSLPTVSYGQLRVYDSEAQLEQDSTPVGFIAVISFSGNGKVAVVGSAWLSFIGINNVLVFKVEE